MAMRMPALTGRALGLVLIFLTAIIWVAASFVSQLLVTHEEGRPDFNVPPFLLTYLSTSIFTIFLPLVQLKSLVTETWLLRRSFKYKPLGDDDESAPITAAAAAGEQDDDSSPSCRAAAGAAGGGLTADLEAAEVAAAAEAASKASRASHAAHREALTAAAQCFLFWFAAQFLFNQSLQLTSVTSNTILSSTSSLFTFTLSMLFLREPYSAAKLASIAACMGGTLLVTLSDESSSSGAGSSVRDSSGGGGPSHSVWGDMLCLVSAAFYACYTIVLRKALPDEDEANVALFFGYVGLLCSIVFAPVVGVAAGVGALHLKAIPSKAYLIILVQGILNYCLSDYLWAHAVLLLGPTIATLGLSVQIPVAAVVEALIGHPKWLSSGAAMAMTLAGTALIMAGFVAGNLAGGGHVYGSHHRADVDVDDDQQQHCRSPGGRLADDSFTDRRITSPARPANGNAGPHTSNHTHNHNSNGSTAHNGAGVFKHFPDNGGDGDADGDGQPYSPAFQHRKQEQQQQQGTAGSDGGGLSIPVSTHASTGRPHSSSSGGPGGGSPARHLAAAAEEAAAAAAAAGSGMGHLGPSSGSRTPRAAAKGAGQLLAPSSPPKQQQQQQADAGIVRQPQVSQQWESIELSSSPFGSDSRRSEAEGSPLALSGLRPKQQLPTQRTHLAAGTTAGEGGEAHSIPGGQTAAGAAAGAAHEEHTPVAAAATADLLGEEQPPQS